jgi:hypothetical protein
VRKSDKKLDNELRKSFTHLCENKLKAISGFEWCTHSANYTDVKRTLKVTCVFTDNISMSQFLASSHKSQIESDILRILSNLNIKVTKLEKVIRYDSEENCTLEHKGNWARRLKD